MRSSRVPAQAGGVSLCKFPVSISEGGITDEPSVEVQGGRCGYVAVLAGLSVGALAVYTPEEGITLSMLATDIQSLKTSFANDQGMNRAGKLILRFVSLILAR